MNYDRSSYSSFYINNLFTTGSVGIGTNLPQAKLDINNTVRIAPFSVGESGVGYKDTGAELRILNGNIYNPEGNAVSKISFGGMYNPSGSSPVEITYNSISWASGQLKIRNNQQDKIVIGGGDEWGHQNISINPQGGSVGIGTTAPDQKLTVKGKIHAEEVIVDLNVPVADYVFAKDYDLMPLHKVEQYVNQNSHLPDIPSASEIKEEGLSVGEMQNKLLKKIEELTLYVIELKKENQQQEKRIKELETK